MRITAIQTTRRGRFALFGEEGFLFSLDSETFFARHIQEGDCFSPGELAELDEAIHSVTPQGDRYAPEHQALINR